MWTSYRREVLVVVAVPVVAVVEAVAGRAWEAPHPAASAVVDQPVEGVFQLGGHQVVLLVELVMPVLRAAPVAGLYPRLLVALAADPCHPPLVGAIGITMGLPRLGSL